MTLTFPLLCFPFLLDFLRISLWDSHKYFARHFRILAGEGAGAGTALWGCYDDDMDFFFTLYAAAIRSQCPVFCLPDPGETRTRWRCSWLHRRIPCPFQPFLILLLQHVCNALCGFDFHCESENENENANGCCTSVRSTAIRFYHQGNLLYLWSCASLFSLPQVVSYSIRSPSPSLSIAVSRLLWVHAILAHLLRFVERSHRCLEIPAKGFVCCPLCRRISFQTTGQ